MFSSAVASPLIVAAALFAVALAGVAALRDRVADRRSVRVAVSLGFGAWFAALPFSVPREALAARVALTGFAIAIGMKLGTHFLGPGPRDPAMRASAARFLLWLLVPPELGWPPNSAAAASNRRRSLSRLARLVPKALLLGAAVTGRAHLGPTSPAAWLLLPLEFYAFLSGLSDLVTGAAMLAGLHADETFRSPLAATSPGDFWGRRWNLYVGAFLRRSVFAPLARRGGPRFGIAASFAVSGLLHEYMVLALLGRPSWPGLMLAFFLMQAMAVLAHRRLWPRKSRVAAVALQLVLLIGSSPLFFAPLMPAVAAFDDVILGAAASSCRRAERSRAPREAQSAASQEPRS